MILPDVDGFRLVFANIKHDLYKDPTPYLVVNV